MLTHVSLCTEKKICMLSLLKVDTPLVTLLGSSTPGTVGCLLRPKILDTTSSLQRQMVGELYTMYQIWPHHSRLKRKGHQPKKN
jgi:hypothetical protein